MYAKVFRSMYEGTLATVGPWQALVTFQQLLVLADRYGVVDMTPDAIHRITTIPMEVLSVGLTALEQPDEHSRSPAEDGRRIVRLDEHRPWGWRIVNFDYYRQLQRHEDRRAYYREYKRAVRAKAKCPQMSTKAPIAEAEAEAEAIGANAPCAARAARFAEFWAAYPIKKGKAKALKTWRAKGLDARADELLADVRTRQQRDDKWRRGYIPHGSTYLSQEVWQDDIQEEGPRRRGQVSSEGFELPDV